MKALEREGLFRARPMQWEVHLLPSGDPKVRVMFECVEYWNSEANAWVFIPGGRACRGEWGLVKKNGAANDKVIEMLCLHLGWGGDLRQVQGEPPQQGRVQVRVKANEWNGKTYFNADWIMSGDANPMATAGPAGPADPVKVDAAMQKHGKAFLAAAAKFAKAKPQPAATGGDDIPF